MAKYVVPPRHETIIKCRKCRTMYVPDCGHPKQGTVYSEWEECPYCGYYGNRKKDTIPLWKYNIIKWFRGGFKDAAN